MIKDPRVLKPIPEDLFPQGDLAGLVDRQGSHRPPSFFFPQILEACAAVLQGSTPSDGWVCPRRIPGQGSPESAERRAPRPQASGVNKAASHFLSRPLANHASWVGKKKERLGPQGKMNSRRINKLDFHLPDMKLNEDNFRN